MPMPMLFMLMLMLILSSSQLFLLLLFLLTLLLLFLLILLLLLFLLSLLLLLLRLLLLLLLLLPFGLTESFVANVQSLAEGLAGLLLRALATHFGPNVGPGTVLEEPSPVGPNRRHDPAGDPGLFLLACQQVLAPVLLHD